MATGLAAGDGAPPGVSQADCEVHPPILVVGDQGATGFSLLDPSLAGEPLHRPGSGVREGSGTPSDPYVIAGWCLVPPDGAAPDELHRAAIRLVDTDAHVVIGENRIEADGPGPGFERGIVLEEAANVTLEANEVATTEHEGLEALEARGLRVANNTIAGAGSAGIDVEDTADPVIAGNTIVGNELGLRLQATVAATIEANRVEDNRAAGVLQDDDASTLEANELLANGEPLTSSGSVDIRFEGNRIVDHDHTALRIEDGEGAQIADNVFEANGEALEAENAHALVVRDNLVRGPGDGVAIHWSTDTRLEANRFVDLGTASFLEGTEGASVVGNEARNASTGVLVWEANETTVEDNRVVDGRAGVSVGRSNATLVARNTLAGNENIALTVVDSGLSQLVDNEIQANGDGIVLTRGEGHHVQGNHVTDHGTAGLAVFDLETPLDARGNWWGHETGPRGGVTDACTGELADGEGDRVRAWEAQVCFDPWLSMAPGPVAPR